MRVQKLTDHVHLVHSDHVCIAFNIVLTEGEET